MRVPASVPLIDGMVYLGFGLQSVLLGMWLPAGDAAADPAQLAHLACEARHARREGESSLIIG